MRRLITIGLWTLMILVGGGLAVGIYLFLVMLGGEETIDHIVND